MGGRPLSILASAIRPKNGPWNDMVESTFFVEVNPGQQTALPLITSVAFLTHEYLHQSNYVHAYEPPRIVLFIDSRSLNAAISFCALGTSMCLRLEVCNDCVMRRGIHYSPALILAHPSPRLSFAFSFIQ